LTTYTNYFVVLFCSSVLKTQANFSSILFLTYYIMLILWNVRYFDLCLITLNV
jgi:hypothetical protein